MNLLLDGAGLSTKSWEVQFESFAIAILVDADVVAGVRGKGTFGHRLRVLV